MLVEIENEIIVNSSEDLNKVIRQGLLYSQKIILGPDIRGKMASLEIEKVEKNLSRNVSDCGCNLGAQTMLAGLILYTIILILFSKSGYSLGSSTLALGFIVALVFAGIGKFAGIYLAHARARRIMTTVERKILTRQTATLVPTVFLVNTLSQVKKIKTTTVVSDSFRSTTLSRG